MDKQQSKDLVDLVVEGQGYLKELEEKFSDIKVPVRSSNPEVAEAISNLLGPGYLNEEGEGYITFEMFVQCSKILKNIGRATASEFI